MRFGEIDPWYTVRNAAGFSGNQTVGLPTLVQNPLTASNIVNPTIWPLGNPAGLFTVKKKKIPHPGIERTKYELPLCRLLYPFSYGDLTTKAQILVIHKFC